MARPGKAAPAAPRKRTPTAKGVKPATLRKRKQREAERQARADQGLVLRTIEQSDYQATMTDFMCRVRGGHDEPYALVEYLNTLVRQDYERFQAQWAEVNASTCDNCQRRLPLGCAGRLKMESACWHYGRIRTLEL